MFGTNHSVFIRLTNFPQNLILIFNAYELINPISAKNIILTERLSYTENPKDREDFHNK